MKIEPVEIYSDAPNMAVIRHPGRNFPGSLIQGDSLSALVEEARGLVAAAQKLNDEELTILAESHLEKLEERLAHYADVLTQHKIKLPYVKRT